jgi:AraC family transcriptional regulator, exoenzyme S synthesis regulatory protein ExsA
MTMSCSGLKRICKPKAMGSFYTLPEGFTPESLQRNLGTDSALIQLRSVSKTFKNKERYTVPGYLLFITLQGQKVFYEGARSFPVQAGDLLLLRAGARVSCDLTRLDTGRFEAVMFQMEPRFIADVLHKYQLGVEATPSLPSASPQDLCRIAVSPLLKSSIESLLPFFLSASSQHTLLLQLKLEELLLHLLHLEPAQQEPVIALLQEVHFPERHAYLALIQQCLHEPLTIEEMARAVHQSPTVFKQKFKQWFKLPPAQYLQEKRLEEAHYLLRNSHQSITDIAFACGFGSASHFIQVFKGKYKQTPGQFKKSNSDSLASVPDTALGEALLN